MTPRTRLETRPAPRGELLALEGLDTGHPVRGVAMTADGRVIAWVGVVETGGEAFVFSGPEKPAHRLYCIRAGRDFVRTLGRAWCIPRSAQSARLLRLLGWRYYGDVAGEEVYQWAS